MADSHPHQRVPAYVGGAAVGLAAGLIAVAFRLAIEAADHLRESGVAAARAFDPVWGALPVVGGVAVAAGLSVWLVRQFAPAAAGSGIPHVEVVLRSFGVIDWRHLIPVKFIGGVLAIGGGLALGREGPTVQLGASIGQALATLLRAGLRGREALTAAGAGAGLAATFNAPLAGVVFVLEELRRDFAPHTFRAALLACFVGDLVSRLLLGQNPVFRVEVASAPPLECLPLFLALGLVAGVVGVGFNAGLVDTLGFFGRARGVTAVAAAAGVGAVVGVVVWVAPGLAGGGEKLAGRVLTGAVALWALPGLFVARFLMTLGSYGCGAPGGIFAPLLVLGAMLGLAFAGPAAWLVPGAAGPGLTATLAAAGMAALFAGVVRAPLTGLVLIVEMTGSYTIALPLLTAVFAAVVTAETLGGRPVYEQLLERTAGSTGDGAVRLVQVLVEPGSAFDGRRLGDLGLPADCRVIVVTTGGQDRLAEPDTQIGAGDVLLAAVGPGETALTAGAANRRRD